MELPGAPARPLALPAPGHTADPHLPAAEGVAETSPAARAPSSCTKGRGKVPVANAPGSSLNRHLGEEGGRGSGSLPGAWPFQVQQEHSPVAMGSPPWAPVPPPASPDRTPHTDYLTLHPCFRLCRTPHGFSVMTIHTNKPPPARQALFQVASRCSLTHPQQAAYKWEN